MSWIKQHIINFNIDTYLNPIVPTNQVERLPKPIAHFLGYRSKKHEEPPIIVSQALAFLGGFIGLLVIGAIYKYAPGISKFNPPVIIASLGASAILEYNAIQTPLSQPRNAIFGHMICAVIGVAISKAFQESDNFNNLRWIAGALACALGSLATGLTNTVHPPGGATAVLAAVDPTIIAMGWWFVPVILVGICVMMGVAFITNNIARQYPMYWWSPEETGQAYKKTKQSDEEQQQIQKQDEQDDNDKQDEENEEDGYAHSESTLQHVDSNKSTHGIFVSADQMLLPSELELSPEELRVLRLLQAKVQSIGWAK
ncbi:hypothetical protein AMS68_005055 [Peltaster fructicola]|uniref:HPP transmembrane region domain-containing protein n=1 Tax=Peltaster fructicola TaxID=286661 RepID=A0A6H0XY70_9PEZI|nr:hypothetical protein AMS68_005055 [Peltaster fructicola]